MGIFHDHVMPPASAENTDMAENLVYYWSGSTLFVIKYVNV